jgi:predicted AlkP superfamily phosphohydrolase/phosphomutase
MLAVDAGDISFIRGALPSLPTFQRLLDEGTLFPLRSTAEHISASVWPCMYTGDPPGELGISQHLQWDPEAMRMRRITADWIAATTPALRREIRRRFGRHPMGYEIPVNKDRRQLLGMRDELVAGVHRKGELLSWLRDSTRWDFFLAVFGECHRAGHILWRDPDAGSDHVPEGALLEVYQAVDSALGRVLEGVDPWTTDVVVFALHGMGANYGQDHFVRRAMDRINATRTSGGIAPELPERQGGLVRALREAVPPRLQHAVARSVPVGVRDWVVKREVSGGLDWSRTPAFALRADFNGFVRLNLAGRERLGLLRPDDDETRRYVERLVAAFSGLRSAETNRPILRDVVAAQEALPGARTDMLPDFILRWAGEYPANRVHSDELGTLEATPETGRTGEHRPGGFAIVRGPRLSAGSLPPLAHNQDFPRFVDHLLGRGGP